MDKMKRLEKLYKENPNAVILVSVFGFMIFVIAIFLIRSLFAPQDEISEDQIQIRKGNQVVTVNENGLVEYRTDDGVFYETWDPSRTSAFFTSIREEARKYLANPPKEKPPNAYEVKLWIDGELVTIYLDEDTEVLNEVFEEFDDDSGDGDLSEYFTTDPSTTPTPTPKNFLTSTPTPTLPPGVTATPTPISVGGSGGQSPADCDLYNSQVTQRTVISNTICQTE